MSSCKTEIRAASNSRGRLAPIALLAAWMSGCAGEAPGENWAEWAEDAGVEKMLVGTQIQAESGTQSGTQLENAGTTVGFFDAGDHMAFANLDMTGVTGLSFRIAGEVSGGVMQVRVGSPSGTLLGSYTMVATGGWNTWAERTMTFASTVSGVQTLYLVGASGAGILNIDHFTRTGQVSGVAVGLYEIKVTHSSKCVDVAAAGTGDGVNIQQWTCNNSSAQAFNITSLGSDVYELRNQNSGKCVEVAGGSTAPNANIQQWTCNQGAAQRFKLMPVGGGLYEVRNAQSNLCMDVVFADQADGANILQYTCGGTANQRVTLRALASACVPKAEVCDSADNDCDGLVDEDNVCPPPPPPPTGGDPANIVPLFSSSTPRSPAIVRATASELITRFADRGRDRHARESSFQIYEHYLSWYWEDRTIKVTITDTVGRGGNTIRFDVVSPHKLTARELRLFYMGKNTVAEYCDNSGLNPAYADGSPMPMTVYTASNPDQTHYYFKQITSHQEALTCTPRALAKGQLIEFEISQFLDTPNNGRSNYYGTTFLYVVGTGLVPWEATGTAPAFQGPGPYGITKDSRSIPFSRRQGGGTTAHRNESNEPANLFMQMAYNMAPENAQAFMLGRRLLHSSAVDGVHDENPTSNPTHTVMQSKAGPGFVNTSCNSCHNKNSRALPPAVGGQLDKWVFRVGDAQGNPHPTVGGVFQTRGNLSEGGVTLGSWNEAGGLRSPRFNFTGTTFNGTTPANFSARISPQLVGMGLLEAIPESAITSLADPNDSNGDGVSGRVHVVQQVGGTVRLGRFGWKATQPTVRQQIAAALRTDMGVTTSVFPTHDCGPNQSGCSGTSTELADTHLNNLTAYVSLLAVQSQAAYSGTGATVFTNVGCSNCHTKTFTTSAFAKFAELRSQTIRPYTDLLLHDMGAGLADTLIEGSASVREWRTPPLWGIGKTAGTAGGEAYLHDGRARTLEEAILWHGGEGERAKNAFLALSLADRTALIAFLKSL